MKYLYILCDHLEEWEIKKFVFKSAEGVNFKKERMKLFSLSLSPSLSFIYPLTIHAHNITNTHPLRVSVYYNFFT